MTGHNKPEQGFFKLLLMITMTWHGRHSKDLGLFWQTLWHVFDLVHFSV